LKKVYFLAVTLAIVAGLAVYFFASSLKATEKTDEIEKKPAVITVVNLPANTVITEEMVSVQMLPAEAVNPQTIGNVSEVVGSVTKYPIASSEQILTSKIMKPGDESDKLSYVLNEGQRAISISVSAISGVSGNVTAGEYVDVMALMMVPNSTGESVEPAAMFVTQRILVLSVGMKPSSGAAAGSNYSTVTLAGTPEQILQVYYAANMAYSSGDAKIFLVLRPATDDSTIVVPYYRPKY